MDAHEMKWRHCTIDPPPPGEVYLVIEYRKDNLWQHHVIFYGNLEDYTDGWDTTLEMERCWYVAPPLTMPDISDIVIANVILGQA